jgi:hypothetical protein
MAVAKSVAAFGNAVVRHAVVDADKSSVKPMTPPTSLDIVRSVQDPDKVTTRRSNIVRVSRWLPCLLFSILIALNLAPIWMFRYFPSQDGPSHLANARILCDYHNADASALRNYYLLNKRAEPNLAGHLLLAALMKLLPPLGCEKILLSAYVILFPLAWRFLLRSTGGHVDNAQVLIFPFIYALPFINGYYNFDLSLIVLFVLLGYWIRHRQRFSIANIVTAGLLALMLYFCHIVSMVIALIAIGFFSAWFLLDDLRSKENAVSLRRSWVDAIVPWLALAPAMVLTALFFLRQGTGTLPAAPWKEMIYRLAELDVLASFSRAQRWPAIALGAMLLVAGVAALVLNRRRRWLDPSNALLVLALLCTAIYFVAPNNASGGGKLSFRLSLYGYFFFMLWIAAAAIPARLMRLLGCGAAAISVLMLVSHARHFRELNGYLDEFTLAGRYVSPNSTLLPVIVSDRGSRADGSKLTWKVRCFLHAADYIAAEKNVINLDNYEALTGYFPTLFQPAIDPAKYLANGAADILSYPKATAGRGRIDFVLVWQVREQMSDKLSQELKNQLAANYERVFTSPRGFAELYRLRTGSQSPGGAE